MSAKHATTLPLCLRIDASDESGRQALLLDGWREIEMLEIYEYTTCPINHPAAGPSALRIDCVDARPDLRDACVGFHNTNNSRLWRDGTVDPVLAATSYKNWIAEAFDDPATIRWFAWWSCAPAGFLLLRKEQHVERVTFFIINHEFRGEGIGRSLLQHAMTGVCGTIRAGTQRDNISAKHVYMMSGFNLVRTMRTFHK